MKTGTTYLQALLSANKAELASAGVLVPGEGSVGQALAVRDLLDMRGSNSAVRVKSQGAWGRLSEEMLHHQGDKAVISMEFLSFSDVARAERVVDALAGSSVHVIITVRDAAKTIPAQWQTHCRNGGTVPWPDFARQARRVPRLDQAARRPKGARVFSRAQDVSRMLEVWSHVVPAERIHVVVVPASKSDPQLLWRRFTAVLGVDPDICSVPVAPRNTSLGYASSELLRRVNVQLGKAAVAECRAELRQLALILAQRAALEEPTRIDTRTRRFASRWNRRTRQAVTSHGVDVVGDLSELSVLTPEELEAAASPPIADPDPESVLAAARHAHQGLERLAAKTHATLGPREHRVSQEDANGSLDSAVAALAAKVTTLHALRSPDAAEADAEADAEAVGEETEETTWAE